MQLVCCFFLAVTILDVQALEQSFSFDLNANDDRIEDQGRDFTDALNSDNSKDYKYEDELFDDKEGPEFIGQVKRSPWVLSRRRTSPPIKTGCSSTSFVDRVYVYRRPLTILRYIYAGKCYIYHTGLILKMTDGKECVLEFVKKPKVFSDVADSMLYNANYKILSFDKAHSQYRIKVTDAYHRTFDKWAYRQYRGSKVTKKVTPQQARKAMENLMGSYYNIITHNCHIAQQKTRRFLGLTVHNPYVDPLKNPGPFCKCMKIRIPQFLARLLGRFFPKLKKILDKC